MVTEFLEEAFPNSGTALMPDDAFEAAEIRLFVNEYFSPVILQIYRLLKNKDRSKDEELRQILHKKLRLVDGKN